MLLVEDDPTTVFLTRLLFRRASAEAELLTACNGLEALDIVREACLRERCPELILLDIHMPVMNGFEFLEELQQSAELSAAPIRVVLLSSSTHRLDLARAERYPVAGCIEKPLTPEKLRELLLSEHPRRGDAPDR